MQHVMNMAITIECPNCGKLIHIPVLELSEVIFRGEKIAYCTGCKSDLIVEFWAQSPEDRRAASETDHHHMNDILGMG